MRWRKLVFVGGLHPASMRTPHLSKLSLKWSRHNREAIFISIVDTWLYRQTDYMYMSPGRLNTTQPG